MEVISAIIWGILFKEFMYPPEKLLRLFNMRIVTGTIQQNKTCIMVLYNVLNTSFNNRSRNTVFCTEPLRPDHRISLMYTPARLFRFPFS